MSNDLPEGIAHASTTCIILDHQYGETIIPLHRISRIEYLKQQQELHIKLIDYDKIATGKESIDDDLSNFPCTQEQLQEFIKCISPEYKPPSLPVDYGVMSGRVKKDDKT